MQCGRATTLGPVIALWNLGFPVCDVMAHTTLRKPPCHRAIRISPPACALVSPAVKESVSGEMERGGHGVCGDLCLSVCIQPCFASTGPLKSQVTRWGWLSCVPGGGVCQAGVCARQGYAHFAPRSLGETP